MPHVVYEDDEILVESYSWEEVERMILEAVPADRPVRAIELVAKFSGVAGEDTVKKVLRHAWREGLLVFIPGKGYIKAGPVARRLLSQYMSRALERELRHEARRAAAAARW